MKARIVFTHKSPYTGEFDAGDYGIVDGYCRGGDDVPCAVVIREKDGRFILAPVSFLKHIGWVKTD